MKQMNDMKGRVGKLPTEDNEFYENDNNLDNKRYQTVEMIKMNVAIENQPNSEQVSSHPLQYQPEIDGIRAIAISLVLIYHAWPKIIPGGFIGVDVFFVISGYLISSIIYKEIANGSFSFAKFYSRRIRRLYPALLIVMATVLFLGMKHYLPEMLGYLLKTLIASALFGANIFFNFYNLRNDYFNDDSQFNPLLHFWSLGVEEQFYIFWPCIAIIVIKMTIKKSTLFILLLFIASFITNAVATYHDKKFAFYFPLSRFWQLLIGCSLAYYNFIRINKVHNTESYKTIKIIAFNMLSLLGFALIVLCAFSIDQYSAFPGFWAILPSMGSASLIFCEDKAYFNKYVLSNRVFVFIGKISYPLYLWHWPLLVFAKTVYVHQHYWSSPLTMIILAIILSVFTYLFVENKVRKLKGNRIVFILGFLMVLLLVLSVVGLYNVDKFSLREYFQNKSPDLEYKGDDGKQPYKQRKSVSYPTGLEPTSVEKLSHLTKAEEYNWTEYLKGEPDLYGSRAVFNDGQLRKVVLLGDSHAEAALFRAFHLIKVVKPENFPTVIAHFNWCTPFIFSCFFDYYQQHITPNDIKANWDFIKELKPYSVFIAAYYDFYINSGPEDEDKLHDEIICCHALFSCSGQSRKDVEYLFNDLTKNIKEITSMGIKVFVAALKPEGKMFNAKNMYNEKGVIEENIKPVRLSEFLKKKSYLYKRLNQAILEGGAKIIDYSENLCYEDICQVLDPYGWPVYNDESHINRYVLRDYVDVLDQVFGFDNDQPIP